MYLPDPRGRAWAEEIAEFVLGLRASDLGVRPPSTLEKVHQAGHIVRYLLADLKAVEELLTDEQRLTLQYR